MFNVEHSPFLHSLGYAIGHSLWQLSLLWLVYMAIINTKRWNSTQRYNLAVITAGTGFSWFIATIIYYSAKVSPAYLPDTEILTLNKGVISKENNLFFVYHSVMATLRSLSPYFSCAYLLVMMMLSTRLINGFNEVKALRNKGITKSPVKWRLFVKDHAGLLGIRKNVAIYFSSIATSPLTIGFIKPIILLPIASINNLTAAQVEAVLLHELAHIKRNDYLVNILLQVAEITLFFNPFMRLLLKQARIERENCCDDYVLQFRYNVADYAKALLSIQQHSAGNILALGASNNNEFQLLDRVKRMVSPQRKSFNYRQQLGMLFLLTLLGLGFTIISPREKNEEIKTDAVRIHHPETSIYQDSGPVPFDLIKKIEAFGEKTGALAAQVQKEKKELNIQSKKPSNRQEPNPPAAALPVVPADEMESPQPDHFALKDDKLVVLDNQQWIEGLNESMLKDLSPVFKGLPGLIALAPELKEKSFQVIDQTPEQDEYYFKLKGLKPNKDELAKLEKRARMQQRRVQALQRQQKRVQDSLQFEFKSFELDANLFEKEIARAKKEIEIAPFRVWDKQEFVHPGTASYNFSFSNDNNYHDPQVYEPPTPPVERIVSRRYKKVCCKESNPGQVTTVTIINGKQIAAKVKKVIAEAQANEGWTDEMKQRVIDEIEKELEGIQSIEIKTHTAPRAVNNTHSIMIGVQGLP